MLSLRQMSCQKVELVRIKRSPGRVWTFVSSKLMKTTKFTVAQCAQKLRNRRRRGKKKRGKSHREGRERSEFRSAKSNLRSAIKLPGEQKTVNFSLPQ